MNLELLKDNAIARHSFEFAIMIESYCVRLYELRRFDLARQLFRAGTSIGANIWEGQSPESKADFIHKLKIANKEAHETQYWLLLCDNFEGYPDCKNQLKKLDEIQRLLSAIISSSKKNNPLAFFFGHLLFLLKPAAGITIIETLPN